MEAQQVLSRRGVQRLRAVPGGGNAGARDAGVRGSGGARHGRALHAAGLAVHAALRQADRRLATGLILLF